MTDNIKIKVRNLHKAFGSHKVLDGIDLDVKKDSSLVILGGSGTGKSVLIKTIIGLLSPDKGSIMFDEAYTKIGIKSIPCQVATFCRIVIIQ